MGPLHLLSIDTPHARPFQPHPLPARAPTARLARPGPTTSSTARVAARPITHRLSPASPQRARRTHVTPLCAVAGDIDPDNASVLVCGGGGVALEVARRLKDAGAWVWMLQRSDIRR